MADYACAFMSPTSKSNHSNKMATRTRVGRATFAAVGEDKFESPLRSDAGIRQYGSGNMFFFCDY